MDMVIAFQKKYNLEPNGVVDSTVWKYIKKVYDHIFNMIPSNYLIYQNEFYPGRILSRGMSGEDVLNLQRFLYTICSRFHNIPGVIVNVIL